MNESIERLIVDTAHFCCDNPNGLDIEDALRELVSKAVAAELAEKERLIATATDALEQVVAYANVMIMQTDISHGYNDWLSIRSTARAALAKLEQVMIPAAPPEMGE